MTAKYHSGPLVDTAHTYSYSVGPGPDTVCFFVLCGTGTRFDLVTVPPRGLPPYTPTDPSPARVGRPED